MEYLTIIMLFAAVVFFAGKYYRLKKQLRSVSAQHEHEHNRLVTVEFVDNDIETIALEINGLLEKIQQTIIKSNASSAALKSSIADISHDMKTPLTSVIGYLQLAEKECGVSLQIRLSKSVTTKKCLATSWRKLFFRSLLLMWLTMTCYSVRKLRMKHYITRLMP